MFGLIGLLWLLECATDDEGEVGGGSVEGFTEGSQAYLSLELLCHLSRVLLSLWADASFSFEALLFRSDTR